MSFARPWWLAALALLLPLVVLHLRRPSLALREVSSLAIWERLAAPVESSNWRLRRPRHPVLLALQALALCALVARPRRAGAAARGASADDRLRRRRLALDERRHPPRRRARGRRSARRGGSGGRSVALVAATGTPSVAYRGPASGLAARAQPHAGERRRRRSAARHRARRRAARQSRRAPGRAARARERDPRDRVGAGPAPTRVVGSPAADQGIFARGARCGIGPGGRVRGRRDAAQLRVGAPASTATPRSSTASARSRCRRRCPRGARRP